MIKLSVRALAYEKNLKNTVKSGALVDLVQTFAQPLQEL